jgi:hypothetical protein
MGEENRVLAQCIARAIRGLIHLPKVEVAKLLDDRHASAHANRVPEFTYLSHSEQEIALCSGVILQSQAGAAANE